jgi:hypothetical protein
MIAGKAGSDRRRVGHPANWFLGCGTLAADFLIRGTHGGDCGRLSQQAVPDFHGGKVSLSRA